MYAHSQLQPLAIESKEDAFPCRDKCYEYIINHIRIPCSEPFYTNTILKIHAQALFHQKKFQEAIQRTTDLYDRIPKNPGTYTEQVELLQLQKHIYQQWIKDVSDDKYSATNFSLGSAPKKVSTTKPDRAAMIKALDEKISSLQEEVRFQARLVAQ